MVKSYFDSLGMSVAASVQVLRGAGRRVEGNSFEYDGLFAVISASSGLGRRAHSGNSGSAPGEGCSFAGSIDDACVSSEEPEEATEWDVPETPDEASGSDRLFKKINDNATHTPGMRTAQPRGPSLVKS